MTKQWVLKWSEEFDDPETIEKNWDVVRNTSPGSISVANSILTMNVVSGDRSLGPWLRHKTQRWKCGRMQIRMKPSGAKGQRSGVWGFKNNRKPCQNNPKIASQDSVDLEFMVSGSTYNDPKGSRVANHLTANYAIWNDFLCNQFFLVDSPNEALDFHVYEIEWNDKEVIFWRDGTLIKRYTEGIPIADLDINIALELNVTDITWMDKTPEYPVRQEIDYIRMYELEDIVDPEPVPDEGKGSMGLQLISLGYLLLSKEQEGEPIL